MIDIYEYFERCINQCVVNTEGAQALVSYIVIVFISKGGPCMKQESEILVINFCAPMKEMSPNCTNNVMKFVMKLSANQIHKKKSMKLELSQDKKDALSGVVYFTNI